MDEFTEALDAALEAATPIARSALEAAFVEPERAASISGDRNREGLPPRLPVGERPTIL